jgi:hypothetical protein
MAETEEEMAKQRGAGGSKDRESRSDIPKYVLVEQRDEDEVTAVEARGDRVKLVWREEMAEEEVLVVTDSDDETIEEEMVVGPGAKYLLNPYFVE